MIIDRTVIQKAGKNYLDQAWYDWRLAHARGPELNWRRRKREWKKRNVWKTPRGKVNGSNKSLHTMERICCIKHPPWSIAHWALATMTEWKP